MVPRRALALEQRAHRATQAQLKSTTKMLHDGRREWKRVQTECNTLWSDIRRKDDEIAQLRYQLTKLTRLQPIPTSDEE